MNFLNNIPGVVKNLLIINVLMFLIALFYPGINLGLYTIGTPNFEPYQIVSHMFMHGGIGHIFFNMFALVMFGATLERVWGAKKFLFFYLATGLGAAALHMGVNLYEVSSAKAALSTYPIDYNAINAAATSGDIDEINTVYRQMIVAANGVWQPIEKIFQIYITPTVGASGAIYGLLLAFGMLFPNTELMLLFFPVPIKAKYFIPGLIVLELFLGVQQFEWDNVAHFAHLGGALFGFIIVKVWQRKRDNFY